MAMEEEHVISPKMTPGDLLKTNDCLFKSLSYVDFAGITEDQDHFGSKGALHVKNPGPLAQCSHGALRWAIEGEFSPSSI